MLVCRFYVQQKTHNFSAADVLLIWALIRDLGRKSYKKKSKLSVIREGNNKLSLWHRTFWGRDVDFINHFYIQP